MKRFSPQIVHLMSTLALSGRPFNFEFPARIISTWALSALLKIRIITDEIIFPTHTIIFQVCVVFVSCSYPVLSISRYTAVFISYVTS